MKRSLSGLLGLCVAVWLLAGCASTFLVDSNVRSFSSLAALPPPPT